MKRNFIKLAFLSSILVVIPSTTAAFQPAVFQLTEKAENQLKEMTKTHDDANFFFKRYSDPTFKENGLVALYVNLNATAGAEGERVVASAPGTEELDKKHSAYQYKPYLALPNYDGKDLSIVQETKKAQSRFFGIKVLTGFTAFAFSSIIASSLDQRFNYFSPTTSCWSRVLIIPIFWSLRYAYKYFKAKKERQETEQNKYYRAINSHGTRYFVLKRLTEDLASKLTDAHGETDNELFEHYSIDSKPKFKYVCSDINHH